MEVLLPEKPSPAVTASPGLLILFSSPKVGKTTLAAQLENNLILDIEKGSDFVEALKLHVKDYQHLYQICEEIKKKGKPYKYITIDTATSLEDMSLPLALKLYQKTPMGKDFKGDVLSLPNGAGYKYLRDAYQMLIDMIRDCASRVILLGHVKDKVIGKTGSEVQAKELSLTGKLSSITCAYADAIGYLTRVGGTVTVTFKTSDELVAGARPKHLRNATFVLSEEKDGEIKAYWDKVYID